MLDPDSTRHEDLRHGVSPWLSGPPRPASVGLESNTRCDIAIIGGGITGALAAEHLTGLGHDVIVVDREREGFGSTAASTAMLQWEIDLPLRRLAELYGFEKAADVYRRSFKAVEGLIESVATLGLGSAFHPRDTVYLAAGDIGPRELLEECALRGKAGLPGQLLDHTTLQSHYGFDRAAAIVSPGSAEGDPLSLCHALLHVAAQRGARLVRGEAVAFDTTQRSATVQLSCGRTIEAGHVVLATGYVMPDCVKSELHRVASSWAIATLPQASEVLWPGPALVWEASQDYVYCRTTVDGRIIIGGEDEDEDDPDHRKAAGPQKTAALLARLQALVPGAAPTLGHAWSGAFGQTEDGLPLIGRVPGHPRLLAAYGYGGNGITFSYLASRLMGALIGGVEAPWFSHFAIDRPDPSQS
ncbi:MAG TPA: FAD-binding oxidoreductase [Bosea sp. (in: a-proteobacteria)]|jgi:glycine/D-amino acid oxidase-like deaminating enzyme|uniref:NAD(P)/FAD-dependent oxidoreductase n=1 Tax=Bosea sp. (in: a-proteobacteria) TaxID=1871050 RepID=UPI002DDCFF9D|nr:FAD-binding oxidoreductase [Bosea sp. (in: a-proteobacteria)]HEV2556676.1 FAD-binding oxidoreductase [Bosea sp. (in: a-proteobacteria)]